MENVLYLVQGLSLVVFNSRAFPLLGGVILMKKCRPSVFSPVSKFQRSGQGVESAFAAFFSIYASSYLSDLKHFYCIFRMRYGERVILGTRIILGCILFWIISTGLHTLGIKQTIVFTFSSALFKASIIFSCWQFFYVGNLPRQGRGFVCCETADVGDSSTMRADVNYFIRPLKS